MIVPALVTLLLLSTVIAAPLLSVIDPVEVTERSPAVDVRTGLVVAVVMLVCASAAVGRIAQASGVRMVVVESVIRIAWSID